MIVAKYSDVQLSTYDNNLGVIIDMEIKINHYRRQQGAEPIIAYMYLLYINQAS